MSFAAMSVISSCDEAFQLLTIDGDSYSAKLYKVEEMFNNEVVQTFTPSGPFKENGVTYLQEYTNFIVQSWDGGYPRYFVKNLPVGDNNASCNLLKEKDGYSVFECYFFTDNTKKENCEWFDNFNWVDIYQDKAGYLYRFGDDGTAVELSRTKNSQGKWVYWDCLRAYYKFAYKIGAPDPSDEQ
jgi:hypothetical protein